MIGIIPVRGGVLPLGALEVAAEALGSVWLIGSGCRAAAQDLTGVATELRVSEVGDFQPGAWALALSTRIVETALLPGSPDGRDLAPRLAATTGRPLLAGCTEVTESIATVARFGGRVLDSISFDSTVVATLQPGIRSVSIDATLAPPPVVDLPLDLGSTNAPEATLVEQLPPDPATMDLGEAPRIVGGGAGLGTAEAFDQLAELANLVGASMGGTRVVMDSGLVPFERQIGTTGITVDPDLYIAFGISGAVQHTAGLGQPKHIISVNTDPHCPMMAMADVAIECDAPAVLDQLLRRLLP